MNTKSNKPFDLLLNLELDLNRFLKYLNTNHGIDVMTSDYWNLKSIKDHRRKENRIPYRLFNDDLIETLERCCEWLSKIDKNCTYFYPMHEDYLYYVFHNNFQRPKPTVLQRFESLKTFGSNLEILNKMKFLEVKPDKSFLYNNLYYFDIEGALGYRELPEFLDILFSSKISNEYQLILEVNK